ncbi:hypothetical protein PO909_011203 [Leuciscus waleckii]
MSESQLFPSDDESFLSQDSTPQSTDVRSTRAPPDIVEESPEPLRGRRPIRATSRIPPRHPPASPASSYASAHPTIPAIEKWTVAPGANPSERLPPLTAQAQEHLFPPQFPSFPNFSVPSPAPGAEPSVRLPPLMAPASS